jgi:putative sigma-54 modulation protein
MQLHIQAANFSLTESITAHTEGHLAHALDQYARRIDRVVVMLRDLNGLKGGLDKEVDITIRTHRGGIVVIKEIQSDLYLAISHAADRVKTAVGRLTGRRLERRRSVRHNKANGLDTGVGPF